MRALATLVFVTACTTASPTLGFERQPIIGGQPATVGQFPTVVAVIETQAGYLCTGTLISPTAVLTAGHCVDPGELQRTAAQIQQETVVVFDAVDLNGGGGTAVHLSQVFENPNHPNYASQNADFGHDDDAIVILAQPITDRAPSPIDLDPSHSYIGVKTTQVGFGVDQIVNGSGDQMSGGVENVLANATVVPCAPYGLSDANMLCFDQTGDKGQCNGDSGGPTFDPHGVVIGATSFGDPGCVQWGADTRPSQTAAFITQHVPDLAGSGSGPACGNGVVEAGEACDDGASNGKPGDPCTTSCTLASGSGSGNGSGSDGQGSDNGVTTGSGGDGSTMAGVHGGCAAGGTPGGGCALVVVLGMLVRRRRR